MRRPDLKLLALARQGDGVASLEVARRYLFGVDGFPRHPATGMEYLQRVRAPDAQARAATLIAEALSLEEIVQLRHEDTLRRAAQAGSELAAYRQGLWLLVGVERRPTEGRQWLARAAAAGHADAAAALAVARDTQEGGAAAVLTELDRRGVLDGAALALFVAREARAHAEPSALVRSVRTLLAVRAEPDGQIHALVAEAVLRAADAGVPLQGIPPQSVESALEHEALRGDRAASFLLGRALCGLPAGALRPEMLASGANLRKGVALLLRAADAGVQEAWLDLYHMHSDQRQSVANPQVALFCLEKAAHAGQVEGQRKLGAVLLRSADSAERTEEAVDWLHRAAARGDAPARELLRSLVLARPQDEHRAGLALAAVREEDPRLAMRLRLARHFGLTKLEALSVDPVEGLRPWGLVVGRNPFVAKARLSAPRAVPAIDDAALAAAREAAAFFAQDAARGAAVEGDLRRRSLRLRRILAGRGIDERLFFATADAGVLDALRSGAKWAFRARLPLRAALAAG